MKRALICVIAVWLAGACAHAQPLSPHPAVDAQSILERFASDYATDPHLDRETVFGVEIQDRWWTVTVSPGANGAPGQARVGQGRPDTPTFYFKFDDAELLSRLDMGEMNALTSMVATREGDHVPMDFDAMEGYQPDVSWLVPFVFHFWTRGEPEVISINTNSSRVAHGANATVLYYLPGYMRSGVVELRPGQHANERPGVDQEDPYPNMIIMMRGRLTARIGGREVALEEGQAVYIRPSEAHEFWNSGDASAWFVWLAFGEGA